MDKNEQPQPIPAHGGLGRTLLNEQQPSSDISSMDRQEGNMDHGETGGGHSGDEEDEKE